MNITLIDTTKKVYATYVPLALLRLSAKHKAQGDNVELVNAGKLPKRNPDIIYFSLIFLFNYKRDCKWVLSYRKQYKNAKIVVGGISPTLIPNKFTKYLGKKNIEIFEGRDLLLEELRPDFGLIKKDYSYGFTSRGCPNKCAWCVVPRLEGRHVKVKNWKDTIDITKKIFYAFDNNIFACGSTHFRDVIKYCSDNKIKIDCNQGMDAEILHKNKKIQQVFIDYPNVWHNIRFAWDGERVNKSILFVFDFLEKNKINSKLNVVYVLYDADDEPKNVYYRIKTIYTSKPSFDSKLMRFKDLDTGKLLRKWGGMGDLFADACGFGITGLVNKCKFWDYMLDGSLDDFITKASCIRAYITKAKAKGKKTKDFIEYVGKTAR